MKPYIEQKLEDTLFIREFFETTDSDEFMWHRDQEDRIVESLNDTNWMFQLDNQLPKKIEKNKEIFIPKETYHRLIKGHGNLKIKLRKLI